MNFPGSTNSSRENSPGPLFSSENVAAGTIAFIAFGIAGAFCEHLRSAEEKRSNKRPQNAPIIVPIEESEPPSLNRENKKLELRRRPLQEGDDGLKIQQDGETVTFRYQFNLHPLRELPSDEYHSERFRQFIEQWMDANQLRDWVVLPVRIEHSIRPEEGWIVPNTMFFYTLSCEAKNLARGSEGFLAMNE